MRTTTRASKKLFLEQLEDRCLLSAADPAIAFVSRVYNGSYTYNVTVMNGDGSNQAVIWSRSGPYVTSAAIQKSSWSPQSGTTSPFTGSLVVGALNGGVSSLPGDSIFRIDVTVTPSGVVQASTPTRLVANYSFQPSWSPTGNYIAFTGNNTTAPGQTETQGGIYVVPPTGGTPTLVVADADPIHDVAAYPTWSPDGTSIAYEWRPSGSSSDSLLVKQVIDPTTGLPITNGSVTTVVPASAGFSYIQHLDWSKSSLTNRIAFVLYGNSYPNGVIYTVDASGASSPQLVPSTANGGGPDQPTWSPDDPTTPAVDETDKFLLYEVPVPTGKHGSGMEIVRQQLATGTVTTVVPPSSGSWLGWTDWRRAPSAFVSTSTPTIASAIITATTNSQPASSKDRQLSFVNREMPTPLKLGAPQAEAGRSTDNGTPSLAALENQISSGFRPVGAEHQAHRAPMLPPASTGTWSFDGLNQFWSGFDVNLVLALNKTL